MSQHGTDGDDNIIANTNTVYGLDGSDKIFTAQDYTVIYGGGGHDFIANKSSGYIRGLGGDGYDTIHGGSAADEIYGESGCDLLVGGEFLYASAASTGTIVQFGAATGNDYLDGGGFFDALYGLDGNDTLFGGDGDDLNTNGFSLPGDAGANWSIKAGLYGGTGDDYLDGGRGRDYLDGGADNDKLIGGEGNDTLLGGAGNDTILADHGADVAWGAAATTKSIPVSPTR